MFRSRRLPAIAVLILIAALLVLATSARADIVSLDLSRYQLTSTLLLPPVTAEEASAVTYNWDTNSLFVLGDEGEYLVEVSKTTGAQVSSMRLTGFDDTEGLTYIGNGQFVILEERLRNAYLVSYVAGSSVDRSSLSYADLGFTIGNIGLEGISYDPRDGSFVTVKEKQLPGVNLNTAMIFANPGTATITSLFDPALLGLLDLSDVQVLSTVPVLAGTSAADNLLILSQESALILEVTRAGSILSQYDLSGLSFTAEGLTIDTVNGNIYVVGETGPTLYVLSPTTAIPVPAAFWLFGSGLALMLKLRRRA